MKDRRLMACGLRGLGRAVVSIHFEVAAGHVANRLGGHEDSDRDAEQDHPDWKRECRDLDRVNARRQKLVKEHSGVVAEAVDQQRRWRMRRW